MGPLPGPVQRGVGSDTAWTCLHSYHDSFGMRSGWQKSCCQACVVWQAVACGARRSCAGLCWAPSLPGWSVCACPRQGSVSLRVLPAAALTPRAAAAAGAAGAASSGGGCVQGEAPSWGPELGPTVDPGASVHLGRWRPVCSVEWQEPPRVGSPAAAPQQLEATWPGPRQDGETGVSPPHGPSRQEAVEL